ncbi:hypothetical protein [Methanolobus halotolerans]|uniref:Uncharacterized protein n=1 Tax=Methanolobus halotolerans TaxID=2052935 RepID=A0A4E0Q4U0_9EURY|nr:hypothetical protein [Methanolobus halotolerans]TGC08901.1 hypothetical protein CUN85_07650 [Methanolobus halotolerans]
MKNNRLANYFSASKDGSEIVSKRKDSGKVPDLTAGSQNKSSRVYERARDLYNWAQHYHRINVRPKNHFSSFRIEHLTDNDSMLITGKLADGSWDIQQWLINKGDIRFEDGKIVADDPRIQHVVSQMHNGLRSVPRTRGQE